MKNSTSQIKLPNDFRDMLGLLISCEVEFLLVGGMAFAAYGEPRMTKDLDIWVNPTPDNAHKLFNALNQFGAPTHGATAADFAKTGTVLQLGVPPVRIDLITAIDGISFAAAWPNRLLSEFADIPEGKVPVISTDDIITNKTASARPQDLIDVEQIQKYVARKKEISKGQA